MVWTFSNGEWKVENIHVNPMLGPSVEALIDSGAKRGDLIIQDGEGWRLVSAYWIHAGLIHLFLAIFGLIAFGWGMEKEWGWMRVAPIYLIGGLFGELLSTMIVPTTVGVGALGAVLALFGAEWGDIAQNHRLYQRSVIKQTITLVLFMFMCMFVGLLPFIDNWANVGGTAMGILLGTAILVREDPALSQARKRIQNFVRMAAAIGALAMVIAGFAVLYTNVHGEWCGEACEALDCQEFPVGNATGIDKWWYCSDCRLYGFTSYLQVSAPFVGSGLGLGLVLGLGLC
ncbi:rhomboid family-domain-containing protein [Tribonema minus]|uniref:rhomboid protease n=1 Tax=Tribonema minus TaxID=303371 RepID=A0A835Z6N5_9STRA|nr:rhomboid family-domain-containing protein [Tribonema minus]